MQPCWPSGWEMNIFADLSLSKRQKERSLLRLCFFKHCKNSFSDNDFLVFIHWIYLTLLFSSFRRVKMEDKGKEPPSKRSRKTLQPNKPQVNSYSWCQSFKESNNNNAVRRSFLSIINFSESAENLHKKVWLEAFLPVLWIHDILVWIHIRGSMPLTNGSGFGSWSCYFRHWTSRRLQKTNLNKSFLHITFWRYIYIIFQR